MTSRYPVSPYKIRKSGDVILILYLQNLSQNKKFININPLFSSIVDSPLLKINVFFVKKVGFFIFFKNLFLT